MTPFEIFLVALVIVMSAGFVVEEVRLRIKTKRLINSIVTLTLDNSVLEKELQETPFTPAETDSFIKFLSDSREWAFTYIEDVQEALVEMQAAMQDGNEAKINEAYTKLMTFLPEKMNND